MIPVVKEENDYTKPVLDISFRKKIIFTGSTGKGIGIL